MVETGEKKTNKIVFGVLSVLGLLIIGLTVSIIVVFRHNDENIRAATEVCRTIEEDYTEVSEDSLAELVDKFEAAIKDEDEPNTDFEYCYIILRDFYQQNGNQEKALYYDDILDKILPKDDRSKEELMKGVV